MSSINIATKAKQTFNHNGLKVKVNSAETQLKRLTLAAMLWEKQFYLDGVEHTKLIANAINQCSAEFVSNLAIEARTKFKLRHIPLLLTRELAKVGELKAEVLDSVIQRPDEMSEFLSLYWKDGKSPISNQVKKGLAKAFVKFNEYQLAKWDKNSAAISLRDVMFLSHAKPSTVEQEALFKRVANQKLVTPDTWETQLSAGANKKETFQRLMDENALGALAFLRNLRLMVSEGVDENQIRGYSCRVNVSKVLPFRYIAAARIVPQFEDMLEKMMLRSLATMEKLPGKTILLVDVSGSMFGPKVSAKSELDRFDAAAALAMLCREVCEDVEIYTFSNSLVRVAPRSGFALRDVLSQSQPHGGTNLGTALRNITSKHDRIIVFTDEQSSDHPVAPACKHGYILNVAAYENGINHSAWTTVSGFSEATIDFIRESEKE